MILRILSDIHLESCPNYFIAEMAGEEDQTLILAGDTYPYYKTIKGNRRDFFKNISDRFKNIIYVPGNHEYYFGDFNKGDELLREYFSEFYNIFYLNGNCVEIDGIKIVGCALWSDIDPITESHFARFFNDYRTIRSGEQCLSVAQTVFLHQEHKKFIKENTDSNCVVVSHHCPSYKSVHAKFTNDDYNPFFYSHLDDLIIETSPRLWIHGHTHCSFNYAIGDTRIICNPKGYYNPYRFANPENLEFDEFLIYDLAGGD